MFMFLVESRDESGDVFETRTVVAEDLLEAIKTINRKFGRPPGITRGYTKLRPVNIRARENSTRAAL